MIQLCIIIALQVRMHVLWVKTQDTWLTFIPWKNCSSHNIPSLYIICRILGVSCGQVFANGPWISPIVMFNVFINNLRRFMWTKQHFSSGSCSRLAPFATTVSKSAWPSKEGLCNLLSSCKIHITNIDLIFYSNVKNLSIIGFVFFSGWESFSNWHPFSAAKQYAQLNPATNETHHATRAKEVTTQTKPFRERN